MLGENFVRITGKLIRIKHRELEGGGYMFKATLAIPSQDHDGFYQYLKVAAWGEMAEDLSKLNSSTYVKVHGHIEESSYDGQCRHCSGFDKKYWTEVMIDNFIQLD
jgi:hypothetical protein